MSEKKENREEEKERNSSRSGLTDEQIEAALNACTFGQTKETRCKNCPIDSGKEPCITNLHLAALAYIRRLKHRAKVAEMALKSEAMCHVLKYFPNEISGLESCIQEVYEAWIYQAEKELAEERKDD